MLIRKALVAAALLALPLAGLAQSQDELIDRYTTFAGSKENATQLVTGMRDGKTVTVKSGTTAQEIEFTHKMGYGNIDNALALAEASVGKTTASPAELNAALNGGTVGSKTYEGILKMRYEDKMGWGLIAQKLGFKLGELKRSDKAQPKTASTGASAKIERAQRPDRPERPQRPEKPERPEKPR